MEFEPQPPALLASASQPERYRPWNLATLACERPLWQPERLVWKRVALVCSRGSVHRLVTSSAAQPGSSDSLVHCQITNPLMSSSGSDHTTSHVREELVWVQLPPLRNFSCADLLADMTIDNDNDDMSSWVTWCTCLIRAALRMQLPIHVHRLLVQHCPAVRSFVPMACTRHGQRLARPDDTLIQVF